MSKLTPWRTPFESERFPSIWVTCEGDLDRTSVFVGWPAQWQVKFEHIVGLKVSNETYDNNRRFWVDGNLDAICTYTWLESPWLTDFNAEYLEAMTDSLLTHYVFLGGDYNVEVLAHGKIDVTNALQ